MVQENRGEGVETSENLILEEKLEEKRGERGAKLGKLEGKTKLRKNKQTLWE